MAGVVLLALFGVVESRAVSPLVDFGLWRERLFTGGFFAESAVGFVYIPFLTFVGSLFFINVLGYSPGKASWVTVITTGVCMVVQPAAGKWVDKIGPGIPITLSLVLQAVVLGWIGLAFGPGTSLAEMVIPMALMGIGVGIALPACNTSGMSAVDADRAGMGSGLMQMTFNIPAALGVALVTSVIGTLTAGSSTGGATSRAAVSASSSAITTSMLALAVVALAGAIFAWVVIGRRTPATAV